LSIQGRGSQRDLSPLLKEAVTEKRRKSPKTGREKKKSNPSRVNPIQIRMMITEKEGKKWEGRFSGKRERKLNEGQEPAGPEMGKTAPRGGGEWGAGGSGPSASSI